MTGFEERVLLFVFYCFSFAWLIIYQVNKT
jgi:hypothetical protein